MTKTRSLSGTVVAITGAARGIGLATATLLHERGALVALGDIDAELAAAEAAALGARAVGLPVDVTDDESFARFLRDAAIALGSVDVLVNNAGIMPIGPFLDESVDTHRRALDIDVSGPLIGMKAVLPDMLARRRGHVVNVASVAGTAPVPGGITYAAAKAAVVSMTESARVEFAGQGVDFTCVLPSFTNTELIAGTKGTRLVPTVEPEDVAAGIVEALQSRRKDVYVPKVLGAVAGAQPLLGRRLRDKVNQLIGAYTVFLDVDAEARRSYDARISGAERARDQSLS